MAVSRDRPIVITMGDPSGVGPEVTVTALAALDASERRSFAVIGDRAVLSRALSASGIALPLVQSRHFVMCSASCPTSCSSPFSCCC